MAYKMAHKLKTVMQNRKTTMNEAYACNGITLPLKTMYGWLAK